MSLIISSHSKRILITNIETAFNIGYTNKDNLKLTKSIFFSQIGRSPRVYKTDPPNK